MVLFLRKPDGTLCQFSTISAASGAGNRTCLDARCPGPFTCGLSRPAAPPCRIRGLSDQWRTDVLSQYQAHDRPAGSARGLSPRIAPVILVHPSQGRSLSFQSDPGAAHGCSHLVLPDAPRCTGVLRWSRDPSPLWKLEALCAHSRTGTAS